MSETVTVQFFGICTHLDPAVLRELPGRRVLLVNASQAHIDEHPQLRGHAEVFPHVARLQIARADLIEPPPVSETWMQFIKEESGFLVWELHGVRMRVINAMETSPVMPETLSCLPQLVEYAGGRLPDLGPAAWEERPELTACWFDFPVSPLLGRTWNESGVGVVPVGLSGPPILEITAFQGRGQVTIPVRTGAHITLSNVETTPRNQLDEPVLRTNNDFLLHFLATATFPADPHPPGGPSFCPPLISANKPLDDMSGPGCGNAIYP